MNNCNDSVNLPCFLERRSYQPSLVQRSHCQQNEALKPAKETALFLKLSHWTASWDNTAGKCCLQILYCKHLYGHQQRKLNFCDNQTKMKDLWSIIKKEYCEDSVWTTISWTAANLLTLAWRGTVLFFESCMFAWSKKSKLHCEIEEKRLQLQRT